MRGGSEGVVVVVVELVVEEARVSARVRVGWIHSPAVAGSEVMAQRKRVWFVGERSDVRSS